MRDALKILCWNTDDSVWDHWNKIVDQEVTLIRALDGDSAKLQLESDAAFAYFFVFLEDKEFSKRVEDVVYLCGAFPNTKVIVFPNQPSQTAALRLLSSGVRGQCSPYIGKEQLALALSVVGSGEIWGGKSFILNLIAQSAPKQKTTTDQVLLSSLSEREVSVADYISHGLSNKQIAIEMDITERTVKSHLTSIFKKTNTKDRLSLALLVQGAFSAP